MGWALDGMQAVFLGAPDAAFVEELCSVLGVPCTVLRVISDAPYEAIIAAAQAHDCDLIAMASHGRRGIKGMLIGSETQKVLTHSVIPVLVYR